jgi:hypothetical protein
LGVPPLTDEVFIAASYAQKAVDLLQSLQPQAGREAA